MDCDLCVMNIFDCYINSLNKILPFVYYVHFIVIFIYLLLDKQHPSQIFVPRNRNNIFEVCRGIKRHININLYVFTKSPNKTKYL